jgi:hypothetical protein
MKPSTKDRSDDVSATVSATVSENVSDDVKEHITLAQFTIGQAIQGARGGEDREVAQTVRDLGEHLVRQIHGLLKLTRMHASDNAAFVQPTREAVQTLQRLYDLLGVTHLVCVEGLVYVNDVRVRVDERSALELGDELLRHGCGGLTFEEPLDGVEVRALCGLIVGGATGPAAAFAVVPGSDPPRSEIEGFRASLLASGLDQLSVSGVHRFVMSSQGQAARHADPRVVVRAAMVAVAEAFDNLFLARLPNAIPIRRAVIGLIEHADEAIVASADLDPTLPAHAQHAVRVTTLSLRIALELGFSDAALADLGVACMLHDVGYADRVGGLPPHFEAHSGCGARLLLRQRGFHQAKIKRLLATIEHHTPFDATPRPSLYARILRIADDYDTLTRDRRPGALATPPEALGRMQTAVGTQYDPVLFQIFLNAVGPFPPGTRLLLADGRVVVSASCSRGAARFGKPICRLLRFADGRAPAEPVLVDLALEGRVVNLG